MYTLSLGHFSDYHGSNATRKKKQPPFLLASPLKKPSEFSLPNPPQQASVNSIGWLAKTVGEMWPVTRVSMSFPFPTGFTHITNFPWQTHICGDWHPSGSTDRHPATASSRRPQESTVHTATHTDRSTFSWSSLLWAANTIVKDPTPSTEKTRGTWNQGEAWKKHKQKTCATNSTWCVYIYIWSRNWQFYKEIERWTVYISTCLTCMSI